MQARVNSFKRHQDEEEIREMRKHGIIADIPQQYGVELPLISYAEVVEFASELTNNTKVDAEGKMRNRKMEFVSSNYTYNIMGICGFLMVQRKFFAGVFSTPDII